MPNCKTNLIFIRHTRTYKLLGLIVSEIYFSIHNDRHGNKINPLLSQSRILLPGRHIWLVKNFVNPL